MKWATTTLTVALVVAVVGGAAPRALGDSSSTAPLLYVTQDESTIERTIAEYIERVDNVTATYRLVPGNNDDLVLQYTLSPDGVPPVRLIIDTEVSGRGPSGEVTERVIHLTAGYPLPDSARNEAVVARLLALNNLWQERCWIPHSIHVREEGLLVMQSHLNIPDRDTPVSAEAVRDLIIRMLMSWQEYYPRLEKALSGGSVGLNQHHERGTDAPAGHLAVRADRRPALWETRQRSSKTDLNL